MRTYQSVRRSFRIGLLVIAASVAGCGYFNNDTWPVLKQDPIPDLATPATNADDNTPIPAPVNDGVPLINGLADAEDRLQTHRQAFAPLNQRATDQTDILGTAPQTPDAWGQAQIAVSRLVRTQADLDKLIDRVRTDAALLAALPIPSADKADLVTAFDALSSTIVGRQNTFTTIREMAEQNLRDHIPEDRYDTTPAPRLPNGRPALTVDADADAAAYSQALATLLEKAEAINPQTVYHVVASPGQIAAARIVDVQSLLRAAGVDEARIQTSIDPAADIGSIRIYVQ